MWLYVSLMLCVFFIGYGIVIIFSLPIVSRVIRICLVESDTVIVIIYVYTKPSAMGILFIVSEID